MQAPITARLPLLVHPTAPLLRPAYALPAAGLPVFPPTWQVVPSSRALVLRHDDGRTLMVDTVKSTVDIKRVAHMTLGSHRLAVHSDDGRCEAHWAGYRLTTSGSLAQFMNLLLGLIWD
jgi:hypothetical protein